MKIHVNNQVCRISQDEDGEFQYAVALLRDYLITTDPVFGKSQWDGVTRFCTPGGRFPTGFLPDAYNYLSESLNIDLIDERENMCVPDSDWRDRCEFLRDYQFNALEKIVTNRFQGLRWYRGIIDAATNSGKDYIMAGLLEAFSQHDAILLVHNEDIFRKAVDFFSTYADVGIINPKQLDTGQRLIIAMYKTLHNRLHIPEVHERLQRNEILFVDENHRASGKQYQKVIKHCDSFAKLFFSGTPIAIKRPSKQARIVGASGKQLVKISNKEMITRGYSLKPIIKVKLNKVFRDEYNSKDDYDTNIVYSPNRLHDIKEYIAYNPTKSILISVNRLHHGEYLLNHLLSLYPHESIEFLHGNSEFRQDIIDDFSNGRIRILITTLLREGVNIPLINTLMLAQGGSSEADIKQLIGRTLRDDQINDEVEIIDWFDDTRYQSKHSMNRIRIYVKESFDIDFEYECNKYGVPKI